MELEESSVNRLNGKQSGNGLDDSKQTFQINFIQSGVGEPELYLYICVLYLHCSLAICISFLHLFREKRERDIIFLLFLVYTFSHFPDFRCLQACTIYTHVWYFVLHVWLLSFSYKLHQLVSHSCVSIQQVLFEACKRCTKRSKCVLFSSCVIWLLRSVFTVYRRGFFIGWAVGTAS